MVYSQVLSLFLSFPLYLPISLTIFPFPSRPSHSLLFPFPSLPISFPCCQLPSLTFPLPDPSPLIPFFCCYPSPFPVLANLFPLPFFLPFPFFEFLYTAARLQNLLQTPKSRSRLLPLHLKLVNKLLNLGFQTDS